MAGDVDIATGDGDVERQCPNNVGIVGCQNLKRA